MKPYSPIWLRGEEIYDVLAANGFDRADAQEWLAIAAEDRGIARRSEARPAEHLFRLVREFDWQFFPNWQADLASANWEDITIREPSAFDAFSGRAEMEVSGDLLRQLAGVSSTFAKRVGRTPRADLTAVRVALKDQIERLGWPEPDNEQKGWRSQADVERWLAEFLAARREGLGESQIREHARKLLTGLKAEN